MVWPIIFNSVFLFFIFNSVYLLGIGNVITSLQFLETPTVARGAFVASVGINVILFYYYFSSFF